MILPLWAASPFLLLLIGISVGPNFFPKVWHRIENAFLTFVALSAILIVYFYTNLQNTIDVVHHTLKAEYIPFLVIVYTLYTISTGLRIQIEGAPTPLKNAMFMLFGAILSNFIGTTGASMLLIHPFLKWNKHQESQVHLVIFFIFIVSNIGGSLTPLGDAPLFVGYLQNVPFWWPLQNLYKETFLSIGALLSFFFLLDSYKNKKHIYSNQKFKISVEGKTQLIFIPCILVVLLFVKSDSIALIKELLLMFIALLSFTLDKQKNKFLSKKGHWLPILEVARVFLSIFIAIIPITFMLTQGADGAFSSILNLTNVNGIPNPVIYYWFSGIFSAFLDNAPTYLLFFNMMEKDTAFIIAHYVKALSALSIGSIFFGAMTYIGNAPNFMVANIAKQHGVKMPSFVGYIGYSCLYLLPILILVQLIFIR